ncbi:ATP-binding protein [Sanyastnella coralliicola]|uniref:ATP-binding protein n=1 Tax=Sanyastnella coralliicola TaxID=3069118 RepID=UPI0027BAB9F8|nr:ATP-binding protein [Longitalea sp. SCSIO 12813]
MSYLKTRILVVEDNLQDFIIFKEVLSQIRDFFIQIEHAETMQDTLQKLESNTYDIVFLDLFLPDSFGKETFQQVASIINAPVVILSGLSDKNIALEIVKEGAQDYIVKGEFDANLLEKAIVYSIERKKYQEQIEQSEKNHRAIFQSVGIAIGEYDYTELNEFLEQKKSSGVDVESILGGSLDEVLALRKKMKVLNLNQEALHLYGCNTLEEFIDRHESFYTNESIGYFKRAIRGIWEGEQEIEYELPHRTSGGAMIHTLKRWRFLGESGGVYKLLISTEDVTRIKQNEEKIFKQSVVMESIAKASTLLLEENDFRENVDKAMELAGTALNADAMIAYVYDMTDPEDVQYKVTGRWRLDDTVNMGVTDGAIGDYDAHGLIRSLENGIPIELYSSAANETLKKTLEERGIEQLVLAPIIVGEKLWGSLVIGNKKERPTDEHVFNGMMTLAGNIGSAHSMRDARSKLELMNEELEQRVDDRTFKMRQAIKELESFSYSVSHDLRAPLRAISGFSGALKDDYQEKLDETAQHYLNVICKGAGEMSQLIDDLLDFSRIGRKPVSFGEVDMQALVADVIKELSAQVPERNIVFKAESLLPCKGDANMIRQVLVNFIWNAVKFTAREEQAIIEVTSEAQDDMVAYQVKDNGVGFNMNYASKLFGVFQRLHPHEDFEGTGVGLAIVQRVVTRHGGRIEPYGEEGVGATFRFTLPSVEKEIEPELMKPSEVEFKL